jgi:hypothetical protein
MLSCKEVTKLADDLVDKKLPWTTRLSVQVHLFICVRCRAYVDQLKKTVAILQYLGKQGNVDEKTVQQTLQNLKKEGLGPKSK